MREGNVWPHLWDHLTADDPPRAALSAFTLLMRTLLPPGAELLSWDVMNGELVLIYRTREGVRESRRYGLMSTTRWAD